MNLVTLRPTTGLHRDYLPKQPPWDHLLDLEREEFCMPFSTWSKTFTHLDVIHLDQDTASDEPSLARRSPWQVKVFNGAWKKGVNAGGCRNYGKGIATDVSVDSSGFQLD